MRIYTNDNISERYFYPAIEKYANKESFTKYCSADKPYFSIVMLSWNRPDSLINVLQDLLQHQIPMNIALTIQEHQYIPQCKREHIDSLLKQFNDVDVVWSTTNRGITLPSQETLERALKRWNTPYIQMTDDDMYFGKFSFQTLAAILDSKPEYGVTSMWCYPGYSNVTIVEQPNKHLFINPRFEVGFHDVHALGAATSMWRREVFDTCKYDTNYYLGWADYDITYNAYVMGWKLGVLTIPELKAFNDKINNDPSYDKVRFDNRPADAGKEYFKEKWGFSW